MESYEKNLPRATAHQRIQLKMLHGDRFKAKLWLYAKPLMVKGVPPMITDLKEFYKDQDKVAIIEEMLLSNIASMENKNTLNNESEE